MDNQPRQIHHNSTITDRLYRSPYRHGTRPSVPSSSTMAQDSVHLPIFPGIDFNYSETLEQPPWYFDVLSRPHLYGQTVSQTVTNTREHILEKQRRPVHTNSSNQQMQECNPMVAQSSQCHARSSMDLPCPRADSLHGQLAGRLGGAPGLGENIREMGPKIQTTTHQPEGNDGCMEKSTTLPKQIDAQKCDAGHRQHMLCSISQQARRNQESITPRADSTNPTVVPGERDNTQSPTYPGPLQRDKRPTQSTRSDSHHRMVDPPLCNHANLDHLGTTTNRLICDQVQSQDPNLFLSNSRPTSSGNRCSSTKLEQHDSICLPSTSVTHTGSAENPPGTMHSVLSCSRLELQVLVSNTTEPISGQPQKNSPIQKTSQATTKQSLPPKPKNITSPRLETVKRYLKTQGFSAKTANRITKRCRQSTNKLYEAKWRIYTNWCHKQKIDPIKITTQQLGDFFTHLHDDLNKGLSAIMGYRAVINNTIKLCTLKDKCSNFHIDSLIRSFKLEEPKQDSTVPKWNLNLVLNSLTKAPYEPILKASTKHLSWKTAFLTSFATAARVSELTALSRKKTAHNRNWSQVTLTTKDSFVAKNQDLQIEPEPRSFTIPALYDFAGPDLPDRYLCPVRCLRLYLNKTDYFRSPSQKALFISYDKKRTKDITVNTLANWIKNVIHLAYQNSNTQELTLARSNAHEVRALASSTAFKQNPSVATINKACYWRGHSTFTNFYLRDVAMEENYELHMPNVIAASQKIIHKK